MFLTEMSYSLLLHVVFALLILLVGFVVSKYIKFIVYNILKKYDNTIALFLANLIYVVFLILVIVISLGILGIPISPIIGVFTGIIFGIAMSLKTSYDIVASGIILTFSKPFEIGDFVDLSGKKGTVKFIGFIYTRLEAENGDNIILANNIILSKIIITKKKDEYLNVE